VTIDRSNTIILVVKDNIHNLNRRIATYKTLLSVIYHSLAVLNERLLPKVLLGKDEPAVYIRESAGSKLPARIVRVLWQIKAHDESPKGSDVLSNPTYYSSPFWRFILH